MWAVRLRHLGQVRMAGRRLILQRIDIAGTSLNNCTVAPIVRPTSDSSRERAPV